MKPITKKIISLSLCLVTMLTTLPIGMIPAKGVTMNNYEATNEFVISNLSDWNTVATSGKNFQGKTVKLGANIDASGNALATLFTEFAGTFDGQGYAIRNFTASEALLAIKATSNVTIKNLTVSGGTVTGTRTDGVGLLIGERSGAGTLTIQDCSISGSVTSSNAGADNAQAGCHVGGVIGALSLNDGATACLENLNVNVTVKNTSGRRISAWQSAGGVIGVFEPLGRPDLTLRCINVAGSVTGGTQTTAGGLIGSVFSIDNVKDLYAGGTITIANCQSTVAVSSAANMPELGVGGVIGAFGAFKRYCGDNSVYEGELIIDNCHIGGSVAQTYVAEQVYACGGVIGSFGYGDAEIHVNHSLITASFPSNSLSSTNGRGAGLILGFSNNITKSSLFVNNTVTTATGAYNLINAITLKTDKNDDTAYYPWLNLNEKNLGATKTQKSVLAAFAGDTNWYFAPAFSDDSVLTISEAILSEMVKKNTQGFITRIGGQITALAIQDNVADGAVLGANDTYAIRFIATSQLESVSKAAITVIVKNADTGVAFKKYSAECTIYDALTAYDANGARINSYSAADFGAKKFLALIIKDIPSGTNYTFDFTPEITTANGVTITGETISVTYDKNGQHIAEKNSLDVAPLPQATPTVRLLSCNGLFHAAPNMSEGGITTTQRLRNMADAILFYEPDFLGMQEMQEKSTLNGKYYEMNSELMTMIGHEYSMVDFSATVPEANHYTPMFYRTDRWTIVESKVDTTLSYMEWFRWQWVVYQSKQDPNLKFIHLNLHLHPGYMDDYSEVNAEIMALTEKYPGVTIAVNGDHNIHFGTGNNSPECFKRLIGESSLLNSVFLTNDHESRITTCSDRQGLLDVLWTEAQLDHILVTQDTATVDKCRVIRNIPMGQATDHNAIYADIIPNKIVIRTPGSSMHWNEGIVIS